MKRAPRTGRHDRLAVGRDAASQPAADEPRRLKPPRARLRHAAAPAPAPVVLAEPGAEDAELAGILVGAGLVSAVQVEEARAAGSGLAARLIGSGVVGDEDLARVVADRYGVPVVSLRDTQPQPAAIARMSEDQARELLALPLEATEDGAVIVAVAELTQRVRAGVVSAIGGRVEFRIAGRTELLRMIDSTYRVLTDVDSHVKVFQARDQQIKDNARAELAAMASDDAPVVQVVTKLMEQGLRDRASDIHIEPFGDKVRVRYRIDGALHDVIELPGSIGPAVTSRVKILADMNIVERRRPQDGQISTTISGRAVDIRVSTTAVVGGEKVVMRLLDKSRPLFQLAQLGLPADKAERYAEQLHRPFGMVICAGPTGSGKTTTLYASLGELNSADRNIMTIEDPVEYTFPSINQIQINEAAGVTFAGGLRSILRQDPDVILVGEVRDVDTARIAVQSALTGHFVLSSLHATDTVSALHRLIDMGIERYLVASSVTAVVAQRLVRRVCTYCAAPYRMTRPEVALLESAGRDPHVGEHRRGTGCNLCAHTGYLDRIGVYELMPISDRIRDLVVDRGTHDEIRKHARAEGMSSLLEDALGLAEAGVTNVAEVMRSIYTVGG